MIDRKKLIEATEVCEILGVSESTLKTWRRERKNLNFYRYGAKRVLYHLDDVEKYIEKSLVKAIPENPAGGLA